MVEAINKNGFSFVEVISGCPTLYGRLNRAGDGLDMMKFFRDNSEIRNQAVTREVDIAFQGKIIVGKFVDQESPTYLQRMNSHLKTVLRGRYVPWDEPAPAEEEADAR